MFKCYPLFILLCFFCDADLLSSLCLGKKELMRDKLETTLLAARTVQGETSLKRGVVVELNIFKTFCWVLILF